jgi:hypothetical protein
VAIAFKWGNGSLGNAGGISDTTATLGVTNRATTNGSISAGDLIVAVIITHAAAAPGSPTVAGDFTTLHDNDQVIAFANDTRVWVGYKIANAGEVASYVATWDITAACGWLLLCFSGVDQSNPIDVSGHQNYNASQTHTVPSVTPNFSDSYWLAIEARVGANSPDTPTAPLVGLYDILSNSGGRPEISAAGLQLTSTAPTGTGTFTQAAFTQPNQGISICLAAVPQIVVPPSQSGAGSVVGRKRKRKEEMGTPAFAQRPLSEMYKPVQFFDFEEDDETVVLLTI